MPLYDYRCDACYKTTETLVSIIHRDDDRVCGLCGQIMRRLVTAPGHVKIQGGTRNLQRIPRWSIKDRLNSQYGDNE